MSWARGHPGPPRPLAPGHGVRPDLAAFAEWISFEEEDAEAAAEPPTCPKAAPQRLRYPRWAQRCRSPGVGDAEPFPLCVPGRSRPRSLPEPATGYTNPAYFIFEGVPNSWLPAPGEAPKKQAESPAGGQPCRSPAAPRLPLPAEEEPWCGQPRCGPPSPSRGHPLSPPRAGHHKRPKSAVLTRDTVGLGDCSLYAATHLSQLEPVSPQRRGDRHEVPLRQTPQVLEPPPRPCRDAPRPLGKRGAPGALDLEAQPPPPSDLQPARM